MPCQVNNCVISDDRLTFKCYGACGKEFHATCVGTRRNHEEQIRSYMLPLCEHCQEEFTSVIKLRKLLQSQHTLAEDIEAANNKICAFINSFNVHEAFDSLEANLIELRGELIKTADCTSTKLLDNVSSVLREKLDTAINMDTFESSVQHANEVLTSKIQLNMEHVFSKLEGQLELVQSSLVEVGAKELPATEILEEVKILSNAVAAMQLPETTILDNSHQLSLAEELVQELARARSSEDSGWRLLGSKKIWKSKTDWKAYDLRQLRRCQQEKAAQKARNRRKRNNKINNNNKNNFKYTNQHSSVCTHNDNLNNKTISNFNFTSNRNTDNVLPSDKELLAAAKDRFSKPPLPYRPTVRFQRGPTLNPYPADDDSPSTSQPQDSRNWMLRMAPEYAGLSSTRPCRSCSSQNSSFRMF